MIFFTLVLEKKKASVEMMVIWKDFSSGFMIFYVPLAFLFILFLFYEKLYEQVNGWRAIGSGFVSPLL